MEILEIFLKLSERLALKRSRKFEVIYNMYLMKDKKNESVLRIFLDKRRKVLYNISTRVYEEEHKKVEDEVKSVSHNAPNLIVYISKVRRDCMLFVVITAILV